MVPAACLGAGRLSALPAIAAKPCVQFAVQPLHLAPTEQLNTYAHRHRRPQRPAGRWVCGAIAQAEPSAPSSPSTNLADLDLLPVLSLQGYINPEIPPSSEAVIFAIYDQAKILQYVGFSKNLRASLLTVFSRRPDKAHYFRALHLPVMDQQKMMEVRTAWFAENSGPPPGNKLAAERAAWQEPAHPFTISERGKAAAAEELAKQTLVKIKSRGCKEEYLVDLDLVAEGRVGFLAVAELSAEELDRQRRDAEAAARLTRNCSTVIDGETVPFDMFFTSTVKTNGGYMFDVRVTANDRESTHRVIVGKDYYEGQGVDAEGVIERVFSFLLAKDVHRQTEGMLKSSDFPINYFAVSEVHQWFDDFEDYFGDWLQRGPHEFWRFNRTQDYGYKGGNEDVNALANQFKMTPEIDDEDE